MNQFTGGNFDEFLEEENFLDEVSATAHKRLLTLQLADIMESKNITKTSLADKFIGVRDFLLKFHGVIIISLKMAKTLLTS